MRLQEEAPGGGQRDLTKDPPGVLGSTHGVCPVDGEFGLAEVHGGVHRTERRILPVRAPTGMRQSSGLEGGHEALRLEVDHDHSVSRIGGHHEVSTGGVEPAVVQEALGVDASGLRKLGRRVAHDEDVTGLLERDRPGRCAP